MMGGRKSLLLATAGLMSGLTVPGVWAQDAAADGVSGEIIVTAQKRAQSVQDVPLSITAFGGDDLRRMQANDVGAIAEHVANVVATTSANLPAFTIRGIGLNEFASNFDSPVAVHVDEIYKSKPYMATIPFFDVERVEALKGPQGTLFGRNTTGGSVNFYTNAPVLENGGGFNLSGDNHGRFKMDGHANLVLADNLAARFSYFVAQGSGGPYHNDYTGKDYGAPNQYAGRLQIKWFGENSSIRLTAYGFRDKSELTPYKSPGIFTETGAYCAPLLNGTLDSDRSACLKYGPFAPGTDNSGLRETQSIRKANADYGWKANNTAYGFSMRASHDFGGAELTSITSYDYFRRAQTEDSDNSPYATVNTDYYSRIQEFTQELRLAGKTGRLNYLIGGFYEHDNLSEANSGNTIDNPIAGLPPFAPRLAADFVQKVRSLALFTHNEYELLPSLSVVAGLRYTNDKTSLNGSTYLGANDPQGRAHRVTPVVPVDAADTQRTDETTSFRGGINWKPARNQLIYASVSRGFRSGGYSVPFGGVITEFVPERLTAYELGYKGSMLDRLVTLNAAVFRYDYKNLQVNVDDPTSPLVPVTRNIGSSRTTGAEADITVRPDNSLTLTAGLSYLDAEFRKTDRAITTYAGVIPLEGKRPVNTPKWTAQMGAQKTFALGGDLDLIAQTDARYTSARYLESTGQIFDRAPSYWIQNARVALASSKGWEFAVWGRNIWDKNYMTYLNNVSFFRVEIYGDPAAYGASFSVKF